MISSWFLFHKKIVKIKQFLEKKSYPLGFVDKQVKFFLKNKINEKSVTVNTTNNIEEYYKLPYISHISTNVKLRINKLCKFYFKSLIIRVVLAPFKVANTFNVKYPILKSLESFADCNFLCLGCNAC